MNDTPPEVEAQLDALMSARSGGERVRMACEMFELARQLAVADIRRAHPGLDDEGVREHLLERLYGDDLSIEERRRIVGAWRSARRPDGSSE